MATVPHEGDESSKEKTATINTHAPEARGLGLCRALEGASMYSSAERKHTPSGQRGSTFGEQCKRDTAIF